MRKQTISRRIFLKQTLTGFAWGAAVSAGLLRPVRVLAASWPANAFRADSEQAVLKALFGNRIPQASNSIKIVAPDQAENGLVISVAVRTDLPDVNSITVLCSKNPFPLACQVDFEPGTFKGELRIRVKMGQSSDVKAIVESDGKLHLAKRMVKVTVGGCGG